MPRYRRVAVKLSGEALAGSAGSGVDPASLARVADEVLSVRDLGIQVAVVVTTDYPAVDGGSAGGRYLRATRPPG